MFSPELTGGLGSTVSSSSSWAGQRHKLGEYLGFINATIITIGKSKDISVAAVRLCEVLIWSAAIYGCERVRVGHCLPKTKNKLNPLQCGTIEDC